jgi:hypothetical protein
VFSKIISNYRTFGFRSGNYGLAYCLFNRLAFYKVLQGMTVTMESLDQKYLDGNQEYRCVFISEEETHSHSQDPVYGMTDQFIGRAMLKGDRCYAILDGDRLASYGWYSDQPTLINSELRLHFKPGWMYMYKGFTHPDYRGQRLHAIGMARALQTFVEQGYQGLIAYVETCNFASLRSVDRMGFRNFGRVVICKAFGTYFIRTDKSCEPFQFTVTAEKK